MTNINIKRQELISEIGEISLDFLRENKGTPNLLTGSFDEVKKYVENLPISSSDKEKLLAKIEEERGA